MKAFEAPKTALGDIDAEAAATLIAASADIALILDESGSIRDVSIAAEDLMDDLAGHANWSGKSWADTVTEDSRSKVEMLIAGASSGQPPRWRHLNHPATSGPDIPDPVRGGADRHPAADRCLRARSARRVRLCSAAWSMPSSRWSATTSGSVTSRPGTGCCSKWRPMQC